MTLAKICGITNSHDAVLALRYGADELGFNFYPGSPRCVSLKDAAVIAAGLGSGVRKIGVFVDDDPDRILAAVKAASLDAIQLHGNESPQFAAALRRSTEAAIIKAFRVSDQFDERRIDDFEVDAILLDAYSRNGYGGTGEVFDWDVAARVRQRVSRLYLAGGLSERNVAEAIERVEPYCVDACSLLESEPGIKDELKLRDFLSNAGRQS